MKNLTFALACASAFALFAAIDVPKADFENYTEETGWTVANKVEPGSQSTYWLYEGASGSEDGSTVKAYGGENLSAPLREAKRRRAKRRILCPLNHRIHRR